MGYRYVLSIVSATLLLAACGTVDRRIDPDDPDPVGGAVLRSQDIGSMADQMARDIIASGVLRSSDPQQRISFHILSLRNDSGDVIDKEIILTRIRTQLQRSLGRYSVRVLDRSKESAEEVMKERAAKRSGAVDSNQSLRGQVGGSDYVLKGTIKDRRIQSGKMRSVYYLTTFELVDLETQELVWTNEYEAKFISEKSVISR